MSPDQRARAQRLADEMERGQMLGYSWGVLDAVALLRELAAEPKCNPTLTECPRCGNRADMQDSHCVMRGGTVMGKPFAVENPSARRTDPERVPLTDEQISTVVLSDGVMRHYWAIGHPTRRVSKAGFALFRAVEAEVSRRVRDEQCQKCVEWKRLYDFRGKALSRPCINCGYVPKTVKALDSDPTENQYASIPGSTVRIPIRDKK